MRFCQRVICSHCICSKHTFNSSEMNSIFQFDLENFPLMKIQSELDAMESLNFQSNSKIELSLFPNFLRSNVSLITFACPGPNLIRACLINVWPTIHQVNGQTMPSIISKHFPLNRHSAFANVNCWTEFSLLLSSPHFCSIMPISLRKGKQQQQQQQKMAKTMKTGWMAIWKHKKAFIRMNVANRGLWLDFKVKNDAKTTNKLRKSCDQIMLSLNDAGVNALPGKL